MDSPDLILLLPLWYAVFLLSLTCHEAAHAAVAYLGGDPTAYLGGQVTLNPLPHIRREPFGTVLFPLLSFLLFGSGGGSRWMIGWASAPYDPFWEDRHPRRAALMAAAGPAANLVLLTIGFAVLRYGFVRGWWAEPPGDLWALDRLVMPLAENTGMLEGFGRLFSIVMVLNLVLFLFNLLPFPPLDGASVLALIPPLRPFMLGLRSSPVGGWMGILFAWVVFPSMFMPVFGWLQGFLYG